MPVECVPSNLESDIRCAVCGQGYLLFTQRVTKQQRIKLRALVQHVLRTHHHKTRSGDASHDGFLVELGTEPFIPALV